MRRSDTSQCLDKTKELVLIRYVSSVDVVSKVWFRPGVCQSGTDMSCNRLN
jgi:hypothetical protein